MHYSTIPSSAESFVSGLKIAIAEADDALGGDAEDEEGLQWSDFATHLIEASDYCDLSVEILEDHRVYFDTQVRGRSDITSRLMELIHAPKHPEVIEAVLQAASRVGPALGAEPPRRERVKPDRQRLIKSLPALAAKLDRLHHIHPQFAEALLAGRLHEALRIFPVGEALATVCEMAVIWSLHDLQMMAAKLYRSIWAPCDLLTADLGTKAMTTGSLLATARAKMRFARILQSQINTSGRPADVSELRDLTWAASYAKKFDITRRTIEVCRAFGLPITANPTPEDTAAVVERLNHMMPIAKKFSAISEVIEDAEVVTPVSVAKAAIADEEGKDSQADVEKSKLYGKQLALMWYGMTAAEAMSCAAICFVKRMGVLEKTVSRALHNAQRGTPFLSPLPDDRLNNRERETVTAIVQVYRASILRDPDHLSFKAPQADVDGSADDLPIGLAAKGKHWVCEHPILPHPDRPLQEVDIVLGRGIALSDKIPNLDVFDKKRAARPAREAAEALVRRRMLDVRFDLSLVDRLAGKIA